MQQRISLKSTSRDAFLNKNGANLLTLCFSDPASPLAPTTPAVLVDFFLTQLRETGIASQSKQTAEATEAACKLLIKRQFLDNYKNCYVFLGELLRLDQQFETIPDYENRHLAILRTNDRKRVEACRQFIRQKNYLNIEALIQQIFIERSAWVHNTLIGEVETLFKSVAQIGENKLQLHTRDQEILSALIQDEDETNAEREHFRQYINAALCACANVIAGRAGDMLCQYALQALSFVQDKIVVPAMKLAANQISTSLSDKLVALMDLKREELVSKKNLMYEGFTVNQTTLILDNLKTLRNTCYNIIFSYEFISTIATIERNKYENYDHINEKSKLAFLRNQINLRLNEAIEKYHVKVMSYMNKLQKKSVLSTEEPLLEAYLLGLRSTPIKNLHESVDLDAIKNSHLLLEKTSKGDKHIKALIQESGWVRAVEALGRNKLLAMLGCHTPKKSCCISFDCSSNDRGRRRQLTFITLRMICKSLLEHCQNIQPIMINLPAVPKENKIKALVEMLAYSRAEIFNLCDDHIFLHVFSTFQQLLYLLNQYKHETALLDYQSEIDKIFSFAHDYFPSGHLYTHVMIHTTSSSRDENPVQAINRNGLFTKTENHHIQQHSGLHRTINGRLTNIGIDKYLRHILDRSNNITILSAITCMQHWGEVDQRYIQKLLSDHIHPETEKIFLPLNIDGDFWSVLAINKKHNNLSIAYYTSLPSRYDNYELTDSIRASMPKGYELNVTVLTTYQQNNAYSDGDIAVSNIYDLAHNNPRFFVERYTNVSSTIYHPSMEELSERIDKVVLSNLSSHFTRCH